METLELTGQRKRTKLAGAEAIAFIRKRKTRSISFYVMESPEFNCVWLDIDKANLLNRFKIREVTRIEIELMEFANSPGEPQVWISALIFGRYFDQIKVQKPDEPGFDQNR
jgi:hypothetical protein